MVRPWAAHVLRPGEPEHPDDARPHHAFEMARLFYPNWNDELANELVDAFNLPRCTRIKKFSVASCRRWGDHRPRSRADITFFDEPYLGLDAIARQTFYDRLLADYAEHPRTILLSSYLIDEIADLIERVLVVDGSESSSTPRPTNCARRPSRSSARSPPSTSSPQAVRNCTGSGSVRWRRRRSAATSPTTTRPASPHWAWTSGPVSMQELIVRMTQHYSGRSTSMTITHAAVPTLTAEPAMPNRTLDGDPDAADQPDDLHLDAGGDPVVVVRGVDGGVRDRDRSGGDGAAPIYGGGSQAPLWYFPAAVGVQAMTLTFP